MSECALLSRASYEIGLASGALQVSPILRFLEALKGTDTFWRAAQFSGVAMEYPGWWVCGVGLWEQKSENTK